MSLKRLPSSTSDPTSSHAPANRPPSVYSSRARRSIPSPRQTWSRPFSGRQRNQDIVEAQQDPNNPTLYRLEEPSAHSGWASPSYGASPAQRPRTYPGNTRKTAPPRREDNFTRETTPPDSASNAPPFNAPTSGTLNLNLRPLVWGGAAIENKQWLQVHIYINLKFLGAAGLTLASILGIDSSEKLHHALEVIAQLLS